MMKINCDRDEVAFIAVEEFTLGLKVLCSC